MREVNSLLGANMPAIGPETYQFLVYATYPESQSNCPHLRVYLERNAASSQPDGITPAQLQAHADNQDIEGRVAVTRIVSETLNHLYQNEYKSYVLNGSVEFNSALDHLKAVYGDDFNGFLKHCWTLANACQYQAFPQTFPN